MAVGFENNIALIPVAGLIASAVGTSNLVGVCMAVGGIGVGFALSPINPYTVGTAQKIALVWLHFQEQVLEQLWCSQHSLY